MSYIYNDEDNAPMNAENIGYPYPIRTLEEMIRDWEEQNGNRVLENVGSDSV